MNEIPKIKFLARTSAAFWHFLLSLKGSDNSAQGESLCKMHEQKIHHQAEGLRQYGLSE